MQWVKIYIIIIIMFCFTPQLALAEAGANEVDGVKISMPQLIGMPLKVMTLNIHSAINWQGQFDLDGLVNYIREVDPDIIGLQEVDRVWSSRSKYQDLADELARRLNMHAAFSVSLERNNGYFGNLILSKHPIVQMWARQLPGELERRSFVFAQLIVSGVRVNFVTTHLGLSETDRVEQVSEILKLTNLVNGPLIICGDMNGDLSDSAVTQLKGMFFDLQALTLQPEQGTFRVKDGSVGKRIDYFFVSPDFTVSGYQVVDNYISDHLPVVADLQLWVDPRFVSGQPIVQPSSFF